MPKRPGARHRNTGAWAFGIRYRELRRAVREREAVRPPALRAVLFLLDDLRLAVFRLAAVFFLVVAFLAVDRLAVDFLAVDFLAAVLRFAAVFFFVVAFFAVDLRAAVLRLAAVFFFAAVFFAVVFFRAVVFLRVVVDLRAAVFLRAAVAFFAPALRAVDAFFFAALFFFAPAFFALDFFAAAFFRVEPEREDPERELELEREDERVRAGMARAISALSSDDVSPMALSPQVSSASADGVLHEPASDVSDVSPVPLQSSWVINDLLSRIARARFPTTFVCNVQRGRTSSCARC